MPDPNNICLKKYRTVAMCIPKCANTSIKRALMDATGRTGNPHGPKKFTYCSKWTAHFKYKKFFTFAFVRNPYARIYSCWKNKVRGDRFHKSFRRFGIGPNTSFDQFVDIVFRWPDSLSEQHFRSQFSELYLVDIAKHPVLVPDFIGKVETIDCDWMLVQEVCIKSGLKLPDLGHENHTGAGDDYRQHYNPATRGMVATRYQHDLEYFCYDF